MEIHGLNTTFSIRAKSHGHPQGSSHPKETILSSIYVFINASIYTGTLCLCDLCRAQIESCVLVPAAVVGISMKVTL